MAQHGIRGRTALMDWQLITDSSRVSAVAYDSTTETIYVRFQDRIEWRYGNCPIQVWEAFVSPGTSKGRYIKDVLDDHPKGRHVG